MMSHNSRDSNSDIQENFQFDCDHLLAFCGRFDRAAVEDQTESILEVRLKDLDFRFERMDNSYETIMKSKDASITQQMKEDIRTKYEQLVESFYLCRAKIWDQLKMIRLDRPTTPKLNSTTNLNQPQLDRSQITRHQQFDQSHQFIQSTIYQDSNDYIKLPPCDTEIFNGSYEQWPSFCDMFTALYINHSKLSPVTKLYHLRNKTRGEAGAIVKRYPLSHENFNRAWEALKTRYENKRVLVDNQIKILFDIPSAKNEDSESLRKIHSAVNDSLATLETLGIQVESWDPILVRLISTKLPDQTLALWEQSLTSPRELPKWSQMSQFLVDRCEQVERITHIRKSKELNISNRSQLNIAHRTQPNVPQKTQLNIHTYVSQENLNSSCKLCNEEHSLRECPKFRSFSVQQRIDFVFQNKICNNCLATSHTKPNCKSRHTCLHCRKTHHTLLHMGREPVGSTKISQNTQSNGTPKPNDIPTQKDLQKNIRSPKDYDYDELPSTSKKVHANCSTSNEQILLRTALVQVEHRGDVFTVRALIDPGSQRTFLSEKIRNRLQLPYRKSRYEVIGIGGQKLAAEKECELILYARRYELRVPIKAIVLPKVTKYLPSVTFQVPYSSQLTELDLADPTFHKASQIDLILGNDYEHHFNIDGIKKNICGKASAYNTIFGWVLSGPINTQSTQIFTISVNPKDTLELNSFLKKFWEQEEVPTTPTKSPEDKFCEDLYTKTTTRNENGRYMVRLPFKTEYPEKVFLGSTRYTALAQYSSMERTLSKNPHLHAEYRDILNEYISLDHMEETSPFEIVSQGKYSSFYLPHHAVIRPEHKTTKVRIVFNASRKSKSKFSLNDVLYTGPTLQNDLMSIILNWRKYKYVFSGDIAKMYRQILVHPVDRPFQRILFQPHLDSPIKDYQLKTVTFGVNCAPYLAIRTLIQLASDSENKYPRVAEILRSETYVDDILSGGHTLEETISAQIQTIEVLKSAGFLLRKITANNPKILNHLEKDKLYDSEFLRFDDTSLTKTLGIKWNALSDSFTYNFSLVAQSNATTKRKILSAVAKLFDPAGWLAPIVIRAKILMQQLWLEGLEWDENVSVETLEKWNNFNRDLSQLGKINIPRWTGYSPEEPFQIHGFSDASKSAYCAALYIQCQNGKKLVSNLLVAKSKVAPIQTISLPRLELSGALLLATLVNHIISSLKLTPNEVHLWTDSTITLNWLSKPPSSWETYVANRIAKIHGLVPNIKWRHVPTQDNPADLGTRGCDPHTLAQNSLWWQGPAWLTKTPSEWPRKNPMNLFMKPKENISLHTQVDITDILDNFSSYDRALRVLCYMFKFIHKCSERIQGTTKSPIPQDISLQEIHFVKNRLIILAQKTFYPEEYSSLVNSITLPNKSPLKPLNPFIDSDSIMRVNGRLVQSCLPYSERYPIILPGSSRLCHLYLNHLHKFLAHADYSLMCRMAQTEFFISKLKPRIKKILRHCKICLVYRQQAAHQIMAPLPSDRANLSSPFQITGIDFAGPFEVKSSPIRKVPYFKSYVSVFVCFSTKAIHLEPCSELSSAAFQATFSRFVGRRGLPQRVVTDNGKNFLGASRILEEEFSTFVKTIAQDIAQKYITHGFEWKFIPPHAPHMGGLWEAAVKSFKQHFKRVVGAQKFSFEEFATLLTRIEGVLNSRPISALSEDPMDLTALTPGHFLRGAPLLAFPEQTFHDMSVVNRWEKLKAIHHQFSIRWKNDYLKSLHKRYKWKDSTPNLSIGDLVVVMDDLLPPHDWRLGRIEKIFPGSDGKVRTANVRISTGIITRPIVKLCHLPLLKD